MTTYTAENLVIHVTERPEIDGYTPTWQDSFKVEVDAMNGTRYVAYPITDQPINIEHAVALVVERAGGWHNVYQVHTHRV